MTPRLNYGSIIVSNMAASLAFYRLLGLEFAADADLASHVEVKLGTGFTLAWDTEDVIKSFDPGWEKPAGGNRIGFGCECDDAAEVDALYAVLLENGHPGGLAPWDAVWGQRYASVIDPDGNSVDLYAAL